MCFQTAVLAQQDTKPKAVNGDGDHPNMYVVGNKVYTENIPIGKKIEVFSIVGKIVEEIEITTSAGEYFLNIPKGFYILRLNDNTLVRKAAIR